MSKSNLITRMFPLEAMKTLANFGPMSWPGLTRRSSHNLNTLCFAEWSPPKGGHNDGIGQLIELKELLI
jgi:hypothetical protein